MTTLSKELRYVQTIVNNREQFDRSLLVRVIGLPPSEEESNSPDPDKFIAKKVYDRILQPILAGAKASGSIKSIPSLTSVITSATRHGRYNPKGPAANSPILITLQDSAIKSALFRAKKNHLPTPTASEQAAGTIRFLLAEDLTFPNFSKLKQLREHKKVDRAWSVEGKLRYTLIDDKDKIVRKVASPSPSSPNQIHPPLPLPLSSPLHLRLSLSGSTPQAPPLWLHLYGSTSTAPPLRLYSSGSTPPALLLRLLTLYSSPQLPSSSSPPSAPPSSSPLHQQATLPPRPSLRFSLIVCIGMYFLLLLPL